MTPPERSMLISKLQGLQAPQVLPFLPLHAPCTASCVEVAAAALSYQICCLAPAWKHIILIMHSQARKPICITKVKFLSPVVAMPKVRPLFHFCPEWEPWTSRSPSRPESFKRIRVIWQSTRPSNLPAPYPTLLGMVEEREPECSPLMQKSKSVSDGGRAIG